MNIKISTFVASMTVLLLCSTSAVSFADGMPFVEKKAQPNMAPADKAIEAQQNPEEAKAPPVSMTPAPAEAAAEQPAQAAEAAPVEPTPPAPETRVVDVQPETSFFGLSVGTYDRFTHGEHATAFNAEWQPGVKILGHLQPLFGAMATTKHTLFGYAGVGVPFNVTEHVFLMPSVAVGAYKEGDGYDLGRTLVYRGGAELAYQFDDQSRLGLSFHAITNGTSTHRPDRTDILAVTYTMPFSVTKDPLPLNAQMQAPSLETPAESAQTASLIMPAAGDRPLPNVLP